MKNQSTFKRTAVSAAVVALMAAGAAQAGVRWDSSFSTFSVDNLIGDYDGTMVGGMGNGSDPTIICGAAAEVAGSPACPGDGPQPMTTSEGNTLYPIDSTFGFEVVPFAVAVDKERDGVYTEGWIGNIKDGADIIGIEVSDAETDTFVVPAGQGTWCTGLGGASVKCSTEHYVTMEHVLTCHETIPYYYADPVTGDQAQIEDPANPGVVAVDCADKKLDNNLQILNSAKTEEPTGDATTIDGKFMGAIAYDPIDGSALPVVDWAGDASWADPDDILSFLDPNESTVLDDIALGRDYSITAKDDGKPLYRWGNLIKRPNDIRVFTRMALPQQWFSAEAKTANGWKGYRVTRATLVINHKITNNPNDQIRPEDMENEGAIGRLPGYTTSSDKWLSDLDCYQGNGLEIPTGTVLRNGDFAIPDTNVATHVWDNNPYALSEDLQHGYTNAWYTTVDREPFEWSYDTTGDGVADVSYDTRVLPAPGDLLSGPRWRLKPNKFGQDIPGLEVPNVNCAPPPYQKALIKYEVGEPTVTRLDLLDWDSDDERSIDGESPLVWSKGWTTNGWFNDGTVVNPGVTIVPGSLVQAVTVNGSPVTRGFDLTVYIKGDRKATAMYNARLWIQWDDSPNWVAP